MDLEVRVDPARDRARLYDGHCHPFSVQGGEGWHARPAKEDRVEPAALTAGSVTLRNGACHFSGLPRPSRQAPNEPRCRNHSQTRPQEPLTVATRSRQLVDLDHRHTAVSLADMRRHNRATDRSRVSDVVSSAAIATIAAINGTSQIHGFASSATTYVRAHTTSATVAPVSAAAIARNAVVGWRCVTTNISGTVSGAAMIAPPMEISRNAATHNSTTPAFLHLVGADDVAASRLDMQEVCRSSRVSAPSARFRWRSSVRSSARNDGRYVSATTESRRWSVEPVEPGGVEDCRLAQAHAFPLDEFPDRLAVDQVHVRRGVRRRLARRLRKGSERHEDRPLRSFRRCVSLEQGDVLALDLGPGT